ncbi:hypothetical protein BDZ97DRAFT_1902880 [Flammula alnicola]|nr:hypothetical protein BDZ97DRAFT_1902880 [Flammula alnicola]
MIFGFVDTTSNAVNARVCKRWSSIALDALWKDVDDLHRLFGILAPLRKTPNEDYEFERLPEAADWKRFEKYGSRVRRLIYRASPGSHSLRQSVFDDIARTRTRLDILPNMHTLVWKEAPLGLCIMFMHGGVKHFSVFLPIDLYAISPRPFFEDISARMPNLINLDIRSIVPVRAIEKETIDLMTQLPKLQKITFPRFYLTTRIAEALSRLEHLGVIEFQYLEEQGFGDHLDVDSFTPTLSEGAFHALWDLSMTTSFADAARFLNIPFAPTNLTMLYIDSNSIIETATSMHKLISILAENCQLLKYLALVSLRDPTIPCVPDTEQDEAYNITIDTLKPALKLPNLTSMEIVHQYPLSLTQQDVELLATSWPSIETLLLNTEPVYLAQSNLTLEALLPFARHCRRLQHFGLFIDASSSVDVPHLSSLTSSFVPFQSLRRLSMGISIITDDNTVALYLSQLLPLECRIDCGITWDEDRPDRCEAWSRVAELVPVLAKLRMEERERTRAMERELEDLRMRTSVLRDNAAMGVKLDISTCVLI